MAAFQKSVEEFVHAGTQLLQAKGLSDEEKDAVRDIMWKLSVRFPDEGDNAAD